MANSEVKIVLTAVDNASAKIKGIVGSTGNLSKSFQSLTGFSLGAAGGLALVGVGLQKSIKFLKESVTETVAYNKTIREMAQVTGLGAEEISRIVQVGDDWGVSIDAIRTSLAFMNKSGVTPSIDNIAKLADEYVNTADKSAFAEKAVKVLGRGYQTLIPLLALGGKGFRDATGAIQDNLVATNDSIAASRKYEVAMDNLDDTATGLKYTLGNNLIPKLTELANIYNDHATELGKVNTAQQKYNLLVTSGLILEDDKLSLSEKVVAITGTTANQQLIYNNAIKKYSGLIEYSNQVEREEAIRRGKLIPVTDDLADSTDDLATAELAAKSAADKLNQAYDDMNSAIDGQLGPSIEDFNQSQEDLAMEMEGVQDQIDILNGMEMLTDEQRTELSELQGNYNQLKIKYGDNATEHEDATKRILFGILEQRAAIGGLTADELMYLDKISVAWGLVDQATLDYMANADASLNWLADHPGDVAGAEAILSGQATAWSLARDQARLARDAIGDYLYKMNELDGKTVTTHIVTIYDDVHTYPLPGGAQGGANFIVPPGYPNDSYPMRVESGEHVVVTPAGGSTTNNNSNTWNIFTNSGIKPYSRNYHMAKAMAN